MTEQLNSVDETAVARRTERRALLGRYASRAAFGEGLLREDWDAEERLAQLPRWLRPYVKLDGAAVADDVERDGSYEFDVVDGEAGGVFVYVPEPVCESVAATQQL